MTCDEFRYWISLKADGRLKSPRREELSSHLGLCAPCREFEALLEKGRSRLRSVIATDSGDAFVRGVLEAARRPPPATSWRVHAIVAAGIASVLVPLVLFIPWRGAPPPVRTTQSVRDRAWLLLAQVSHEKRDSPAREHAALREELAASRLAPPLSEDVQSAAGLMDRLRRLAKADAPDADALQQVRQDIRTSGLLAAWRPRGPIAKESGPFDTSGSHDPFRVARGLLYAGEAERALAIFREYLANDPDPDLRDDALYWIAFLEARRGREPEALGALQSLCAFETEWLDPSTLDEAQRLAVALGERVGAARVALPIWMAPEPESAAGWTSFETAPDEVWCVFEAARGNHGGKDSPVSLEFHGVRYEAGNPEEFRSRHPEVFRFLKARMPAVVKFLEEGVAEFEMPVPEPKGP